jgi:hypothetical protein
MGNTFFRMLGLVALLLFVGCSRIPQPQGFPYSDQRKMQAAHHWNVLANDVANRINNELIRQHYLSTPIYVRHSSRPDIRTPGETSPFDEAFNDLLTTQLVNFGVCTLVAPAEAALVVDYKVQVVYHRASRYQWPQPGVITALTAGVLVLRDASTELLALAAAAAADTLNATSVVNGHYEIVITTSITDKNKYVMRTSDIYYINDADSWQYRQINPAVEIELTDRNGTVPTAKAKGTAL